VLGAGGGVVCAQMCVGQPPSSAEAGLFQCGYAKCYYECM
jgi:hypothetical protein